MQDRVPLYPGRVKLTPVSGQTNVYDMTRADSPTQQGTPLNKASLLSDATASLLGLGSSATPDDALSALAQKDTAASHKIGDVLTTARTDLGDNWLLCNGEVNDKDSYPELDEILSLSPATYNYIWSDSPNDSYSIAAPNNVVYFNGKCAFGTREQDGKITYYIVDATNGSTNNYIYKIKRDFYYQGNIFCAYHDGILLLTHSYDTTFYYGISTNEGETVTWYTKKSITIPTPGQIFWSDEDNAFIWLSYYIDKTTSGPAYLCISPSGTITTGTSPINQYYTSGSGSMYVSTAIFPDGTIASAVYEQTSSMLINYITIQKKITDAPIYIKVLTNASYTTTSECIGLNTLWYDDITEKMYLMSFYINSTKILEVYELSNSGDMTLLAIINDDICNLNKNLSVSTLSPHNVIFQQSIRVYNGIVTWSHGISDLYTPYYMFSYDIKTAQTLLQIYSVSTAYLRTSTIIPTNTSKSNSIWVEFIGTNNNNKAVYKYRVGKLLPEISQSGTYSYIKAKED